jgi:hypothetical protein
VQFSFCDKVLINFAKLTLIADITKQKNVKKKFPKTSVGKSSGIGGYIVKKNRAS